MQYLLCPRCRFRVPLNKHICTTCGYTLPSASSQHTADAEVKDVVADRGPTGGFWQQFFGLGGPAKDSGKETEEPALG